MFGTYRLILALLVLVTHIGKVEVYGGVAVWGFFMLSGFLITGVLNRRYGFTKLGLVQFAWSRVLRLYPAYWLSTALTYVAVRILASRIDPLIVNDRLAMPSSLRDQLASFFILGNTFMGLGRAELSLSPSAWAIDVELLLYVVSAVWLSRTPSNTSRMVVSMALLFVPCWLVGKLLLGKEYSDIANQMTYSFLPVALLPYAIGAWLWHHQKRFSNFHATSTRLLAGALLLIACASGLSCVSITLAYLVSLPILAMITAMLASVDHVGKYRKMDDFLGLMSYPIYLTHWLCALLVVWVFPIGMNNSIYQLNKEGMAVFTAFGFALVTLVTLLLSAGIAIGFEVPIERRRREFANHLAKMMVDRERGPERVPTRPKV